MCDCSLSGFWAESPLGLPFPRLPTHSDSPIPSLRDVCMQRVEHFGVYKINKKRAKQHVLLVLKVVQTLFLCPWPSWKTWCVPDIWVNKDSVRISSLPHLQPHTLVGYLCLLPSIFPNHSVWLIVCQINRSRVMFICWFYGRPPEKAFTDNSGYDELCCLRSWCFHLRASVGTQPFMKGTWRLFFMNLVPYHFFHQSRLSWG